MESGKDERCLLPIVKLHDREYFVTTIFCTFSNFCLQNAYYILKIAGKNRFDVYVSLFENLI